MSIPRVIHYCWFGGKELPALAKKCIASWERYCPDYEIREWNEKNFDVNQIPYTRQAYQNGKYAFVSDYARFHILEEFGGIYMDTDVELLKPLENILENGAYIGCEEDGGQGIAVNPGLGMAACAHNEFLSEILDGYKNRLFLNKDGSQNVVTVVEYTTALFIKHGLKDLPGIQKIGDFTIYPREYFSPQHYKTGKVAITSKTYSIHYYSASWFTPYGRFANKMSHILGETWTKRIVKCKKAAKKMIGR
ncbi:MAG: glycosyl transferase [Lachnospiraceae bacterium]|jgi:mannosyltransferase OCH1-like enzyme|nr:glycosyl transferase [Lachnospiraceae bacterium]